MPLTPPSPPLTPPLASQPNGVPTQVWFVQDKAQNKAFRSALSLHRENATLSENKEDVPSNESKEDPRSDVEKKA